MPKTINMEKFATKKELETHKKEVLKLLKAAAKKDVKQDKAMLTTRSRRKSKSA